MWTGIIASGRVDRFSRHQYTSAHDTLVALVVAVVMSWSLADEAQTPRPPAPLRAGAAKVDVTPSAERAAEEQLRHPRPPLRPCHRPRQRRGERRADHGGCQRDPGCRCGKRCRSRSQRNSAFLRQHVLLTATHTHSAGGQRGPDYAQKIVEAVRLAKQRLDAGRVGYGTGESYINVNRQIIDPKTGRWWEGPNREGPSDKTVAVLKFETTDGRTDRGLLQLRGARRDHRAAGSDQRRHSRRGLPVRRGVVRRQSRGGLVERRRAATRIRSTTSRPTTCATSASRSTRSRGIDISNAMPPGGQGLDRKRSRRRAADESAAADGELDGAVPRRGSACT